MKRVTFDPPARMEKLGWVSFLAADERRERQLIAFYEGEGFRWVLSEDVAACPCGCGWEAGECENEPEPPEPVWED